MKFSGDMLLSYGLPKGAHFGSILRILNSGDFTRQGVQELVNGFINHKLPKNINSKNGSMPVSLDLAKIFFEYESLNQKKDMKILDTPLPYNVFGADHIEQGAIDQMNNAMRLPISVAGAVMPDAHQGYALPIGGVWATDNVVSPQAVGVDISCRMMFSSFGVDFPTRNSLFREEMKKALYSQTVFGTGIEEKNGLLNVGNDEVLDNPLWKSIPLLNKYHFRDLAAKQLGSSGSGNHFCSFGNYTDVENTRLNGISLLTHSGSRGVGNKLAKAYHDLASKNFDNKDCKAFAWLSLDSELGQEYWAVMNLCSDFAHASHQIIHDRICKFLKIKATARYETNHNLAWKETHVVNGVSKEVIVHRKGAVRAHLGEIGIIGGSMSSPSFVVKGKGSEASLCSCSHGAGRSMSRTAAKQTFTKAQMKEALDKAGVELLEGSLDECQGAYKDVMGVMAAQKDLVDIIGRFDPKIVMMSKDEDKEC